MSAPSVTVILCAYTLDRSGQIVEALESVRRQAPTPTEILVVIDHNQQLLDWIQEHVDGRQTGPPSGWCPAAGRRDCREPGTRV